jgi:hypothetical protein
VSLEVLYGLSRPESDDFEQAVASAADDPNLYDDSLNVAGGSLIFHLGLLELGAIVDSSWKSDSASQLAVGALGGIGHDFGSFRLEALGEIGGQRYGDFSENPEIVTSGSSEEWLMYVGLRPGVAFRLPLGETGSTGLILGIWGFARWDLTDSTVPVTVGDAGETGEIELGGTTIGATLRLGLDF